MELRAVRSESSRQPAAVGRPDQWLLLGTQIHFPSELPASMQGRFLSLSRNTANKTDLLAHTPLFPAALLQCLSKISSVSL